MDTTDPKDQAVTTHKPVSDYTADEALLAKVVGVLIAYGTHAGARANPVDTAEKIIAMARSNPASAETRVLLVKPGDALVFGNVGRFDLEDIGPHLTPLRDALGLKGIFIFEADIDMDAVTQ